MALPAQRPDTDLYLPLADGAHPTLIHTHYLGFSVPDEQTFVFTYLRSHPAFPLSQGGVCVVRGSDNVQALDMEHMDYRTTMPWPTVDGQTITVENGLRYDFVEPGRVVRLTYESEGCAFDVTFTGVTPLVARGAIMPGEEDFHSTESAHGGSEQYMHCAGELVLHGTSYPVDSHHVRDRSWNQVRVETPRPMPPTGWTPMRFGDDLAFNVTTCECDSSDPVWRGLYDMPDEKACVVFGWMYTAGDESARRIIAARRRILERHPRIHTATRQTVELVDEFGTEYEFEGAAVASGVVPQWPNLSYRVNLYRWQDAAGRTCHSDFQEMWFAPFQRTIGR